MVTLQEYLDQQYPTLSDKEQVTEIIIGSWNSDCDTLSREQSKQLVGAELNLTSYPKLKKLRIDGEYLATKLTELNLVYCFRLAELDVANNHLTTLDLRDCVQLQKLNCTFNSLITLYLPRQIKLEESNIENNNFSDSEQAFLQWISRGFSSQEVTKWNNTSCQLSEVVQWQRAGFTLEQTKQWLEAGLTPSESYLATWIRDNKQLTPQQIDNDILFQLQSEYDDSAVSASEWLEQYYPDQERTWSIYTNQPLEGVLDCSKYSKLWGIYISSLVDSNRFEIKRGSYEEYNQEKYETKVIFCCSAQTYLDKKYPNQSARSEIKELDISCRGLEGIINLSDFVELECLSFFNNYLTQLPVLANPLALIHLDISNNNLSISDCTVFSQMKNLRELHIGNHDQTRIHAGIYNRFSGSLAPLQTLTKLEYLNIDNTNLDSGLEYLPKSITTIYCTNTPLEPYLKDFEGLGNGYDYSDWRQVNLTLIESIQEYDELLAAVKAVNSYLDLDRKNKTIEKTKLEKVFDVLIFYLEEDIIKDRKQLYQTQKLNQAVEISPK